MKNELTQALLLIFGFLFCILAIAFPVLITTEDNQDQYNDNNIIKLEQLPDDQYEQDEFEDFKLDYEGTKL